MQRTKLQNFIFTAIMAFIMVYGMVCYNIAIDKGGMSNEIFLIAFHEMPIMWPVAVILEMFVFERLAIKLAFRFVTPGKESEFMVTVAISSMIVATYVPYNESYSYGIVCTSRIRSSCCMASEICIKLPNGIFLADIYSRTSCEKCI